MEEEILKQSVPHINTTADLIQFAEYYGVKNSPCVKERLFQLQVEELVINLNVPTNINVNYNSGYVDMNAFLGEMDASKSEDTPPLSSVPTRRRSASPQPSTSSNLPPFKKTRLEVGESQLVNEMFQPGSRDSQNEISNFDLGLYSFLSQESIVEIGDMDLEQLFEQVGSGTQKPYEFSLRKTRTFAKHAAVEKIYQVKFNEQLKGRNISDLHAQLHDMFDDVLQEAKIGLADNDLGRVVLRHQNLENPIVVPLRSLDELNADVILTTVENVMRSHQNLPLDDSFDIDIGMINMPKGGSKHNISKIGRAHV